MAIIKAVSSKASIGKAIDYVEKKEKTEEKLLEGIECNPSTAAIEMEAVKKAWGKEDGRQYKHFVYSFPPGEKVSLEQIRDNARKLVEETKAFKGHQVLIAVHDDREHKHAHIIVNSVNAEDGHKLQWSKADLKSIKERCNELSRSQGLSVPEKSQNVTDWSLDKHKTLEKAFSGDYKSYVLDVANTVADVRQVATSRAEFIELMKSKGIETEWKDSHKNITFKTEEGKKVRNSNLTKTFKVDFGKESLENEFQFNEERIRTTQRAREQLNGADGTNKEPKREDRGIDTGVIDQTINARQLQAVIIEAERRKRELAKAQQERTKTEKSISVIEKRDNSSKERGFER